MQKRFQQLAEAALGSLGLTKVEDDQLMAHLASLDVMEKLLRDVEKASSEIYASFENLRESTTCIITSTDQLLAAFNKDPIVKNVLSCFKNLKSVCDSKLEKQIKSRIEENIFSKVELRRDVLYSIHKRIDQCSQSSSRFHTVMDNYTSMQSDEARSTLSESDIFAVQDECDNLRAMVEQQRLQLDVDINNYLTNTQLFIIECYSYLGNLSSLIQASLYTAMTECPEVPMQLSPPSSATKVTFQIVLKAGLSTIQSVKVKKGEQIWWEVTLSGDVGYGVLFKNIPISTIEQVKNEEEMTVETTVETTVGSLPVPEEKSEKKSEEKSEENMTTKLNIETIEPVRRIDPTSEDIRGHLDCTKDGILEFGFDNSFSYFRGKSIEINVFKEYFVCYIYISLLDTMID